MAPQVVKLGGSLERSGDIRSLASRLSAAPGLVLVPGGGRFADAVREAERPLALSGPACHRMAVLAMEQMAHALLDCAPALRPCRTLGELNSAAHRRVTALWFPAQMLLHHPDIPESWEVTSDSLACWLARTLGAEQLVLVKAPGAPVPPSERPGGAREWAARGLVDAAFPMFADAFSGTIRLVAADDAAALDRLFPPTASAA